MSQYINIYVFNLGLIIHLRNHELRVAYIILYKVWIRISSAFQYLSYQFTSELLVFGNVILSDHKWIVYIWKTSLSIRKYKYSYTYWYYNGMNKESVLSFVGNSKFNFLRASITDSSVRTLVYQSGKFNTVKDFENLKHYAPDVRLEYYHELLKWPVNNGTKTVTKLNVIYIFLFHWEISARNVCVIRNLIDNVFSEFYASLETNDLVIRGNIFFLFFNFLKGRLLNNNIYVYCNGDTISWLRINYEPSNLLTNIKLHYFQVQTFSIISRKLVLLHWFHLEIYDSRISSKTR